MKKGTVRQGFTLIELMIVVSIIGILSAALLPNLKGATGRARDAQRETMMSKIVAELENYHIDNDEYPSGDFCIDGAGSTGSNDFEKYYLDKVLEASKVPKYPGACGKYVGYSGKTDKYTIYMAIEGKLGDGSLEDDDRDPTMVAEEGDPQLRMPAILSDKEQHLIILIIV